MTEMLAGKTAPLWMVALIVGLILILGLAIVVSYERELNGEKRKSIALRKEIEKLKRLNQEAEERPPVIVMEGGNSPPKSWRELQKVFSSRKNFPKGATTMSKAIKEKGVVREVGFFRMAMMFGLMMVLANMVMTAWAKVKHRFEENEEEVEPDLG